MFLLNLNVDLFFCSCRKILVFRYLNIECVMVLLCNILIDSIKNDYVFLNLILMILCIYIRLIIIFLRKKFNYNMNNIVGF